SRSGERQEQVHLGDAELDMLALGAHLPLLRRQQPALLDYVLDALHREERAPVHPRAKVRGNRDVRRRRDYAIGERTALLRNIVENATEPRLCGIDPAALWDREIRHR